MSIGSAGTPIQNSQFDGVLATAVQFVNHHQMSCEAAIDAVLNITQSSATSEQRLLLIAQLIDRTSSPPLDGPDSHSQWSNDLLIDGKWVDDVEWHRTTALRQYRDTHSTLTENAKSNLESVSLRILRNSFNPIEGEPEFHWRGLVAGNVQSGKTATYSTLIARALDSGYRLIIVLSGRLESLRKQTAARLHAELVQSSNNTQNQVTHLTVNDDAIFTQTTGILGDLIANQVFSDGPTLIVAKKEHIRMNQLNNWLVSKKQRDERFIDFPVLIIDDESDEAGIDIASEGETSSNNFQIKRLISNPEDGHISRSYTKDGTDLVLQETKQCVGFRKTMYVAFTATPYATAFQFMHEPEEEEEKGLDLYPRDFILVLDDPSNYCGGEVFVGRYEVEDELDGNSISIPESDSLVQNLIHLPMNVACQNCIAETTQTEDGTTIRTHIGNREYRHFWHGDSVFPKRAVEHCSCDCHKFDESHRIKNPFNDSIMNFEPEMVDSLMWALDDFILSGAARLQRGDGHKPTSMMVLISQNSYQHFRLRDLVEPHLENIRESWPHLGHKARLKQRWVDSFAQNIEIVNDGFSMSGAGSTTEEPDRVFSPRPVPFSSSFVDVEQYIPIFLDEIQHVVLNSGVNESNEDGDILDYRDGVPMLNGVARPGLKSIFYGGYVLGRGLTLSGLVTTYMMRLPGDGSVATQIQRWCGYRSRPGEDILDLMRIYMPEDLANCYRELITVDRVNRFRLSAHSKRVPPTRPEDVFHLLRAPESGWELVSSSKRGAMEVEFNPLSGREKTETTFNFQTTPEVSRNWEVVRRIYQKLSTMDGISRQNLKQGRLFRHVPVEMILDMLSSWDTAPHSHQGFNPRQISKFIQASISHQELTEWSFFIPFKISPSQVDKRTSYDFSFDQNLLSSIFDEPGEYETFDRGITGRRATAYGSNYRIGTVTMESWRTIDGVAWRRPEGSNPLLILTPVTHPFNRQSPTSASYAGSTGWFSGIDNTHWPTVPSLSLVFPLSQSITCQELGHAQFNAVESG